MITDEALIAEIEVLPIFFPIIIITALIESQFCFICYHCIWCCAESLHVPGPL